MKVTTAVCVASGFCEAQSFDSGAHLFKVKHGSGYHMVAHNAHVFGKSDEYWQGLAEENGMELHELEMLGERACAVRGMLSMAATLSSQYAMYAGASGLKDLGLSNVRLHEQFLHGCAIGCGLGQWIDAARGVSGDLPPILSLCVIGVAALEAHIMKKRTGSVLGAAFATKPPPRSYSCLSL